MATTVTKIIDPDNGSGTDYTSLSAWEAGEQGDLTGARDEIAVAKCRCTGGTADTTVDSTISISGWTTDSTHYIKIWTDPSEGYRHEGKWQTGNKYRFEKGFTIFEANVWLAGLQITNQSSAGWGRFVGLWCDGEVCTRRIESCIIKGKLESDSDVGITDDLETPSAGSKVYIWNSIVYDFSGGTWSSGITPDDSNNAWYIYNTTIQNCQRSGIRPTSGRTPLCVNVLIQDCGTCFDTSAGGSFGGSNNCSDDNTQPGSNGRNGEVLFADELGDDFHLAATDTIAKGYGLNLYNDANLPFQTDIDGQDRGGSGAQWDIGADEYVAASSTPLFRRRLNILLRLCLSTFNLIGRCFK